MLPTLIFCSNLPRSEDKQEQKLACLEESSLTPWELWFVGKEKEERGRLQQKAIEVKLDNIFFNFNFYIWGPHWAVLRDYSWLSFFLINLDVREPMPPAIKACFQPVDPTQSIIFYY